MSCTPLLTPSRHRAHRGQARHEPDHGRHILCLSNGSHSRLHTRGYGSKKIPKVIPGVDWSPGHRTAATSILPPRCSKPNSSLRGSKHRLLPPRVAPGHFPRPMEFSHSIPSWLQSPNPGAYANNGAEGNLNPIWLVGINHGQD